MAWSADYYWIGGTGWWNQISHWATTSGGSTVHATLPGPNDDVYFDANSFTAANQYININVSGYCRDIEFDASYDIRIYGSINKELNIYGDLRCFNDFVYSTSNNSQPKYSFVGSVPQTIESNYNTLPNLEFNGSSTITITDSLLCSTFTMNSGSIDFNSNYINALTSIRLNSYSSAGTVNFDSCNVNSRFVTIIGSSNLTFSDHEALWELTNSGSFNTTAVYHKFSRVFAAQDVRISVSNTDTLNHVRLLSSCRIYRLIADTFISSTSNENVALDNLKILDYALFEGSTCAEPNTYSGTIVSDIDTIRLKDCILGTIEGQGTAKFIANNVLSQIGSVVNFTIDYSSPRTLYWIGPNPEWDQPSHWSLSSGGPPLDSTDCLPDMSTNVVFDSNSFSSTAYSVELEIFSEYTCRDMKWQNVHFQPLFKGNHSTLNVFGSLELSDSMQSLFYSLGEINMLGDSLCSIDFGGHKANFHLRCSGSLQLTDSLHIDSTYRLYLGSGSFHSNNHLIYANRIYSNYGMDTIDLGASICYAVYFNFDIRGVDQLNASQSTFTNQRRKEIGPEFLSRNTTPFRYGKLDFYATDLSEQISINCLNLSPDTITRLQCNGNTYLENYVTCDSAFFRTDTNELILSINYGRTLRVLDTIFIQSPNDCASNHKIVSSYLASNARIFANQDSLILKYFSLSSISGLGTTKYFCDSALFDNGSNTGWVINKAGSNVTDLYWVGGSGDWEDPLHWATTSGGTPNPCIGIPTDSINVHFDSNSHIASATIVVNLPKDAYCRSFYHKDEVAITMSSALSYVSMHVNGHFMLDSGFSSPSQNIGVELNGVLPSDTLDTKFNSLPRVTFTINAFYQVLDSISGSGLLLRADSFDSKGFNLYISYITIYEYYGTNPVLVNFDSSTLYTSSFVNYRSSTSDMSFTNTKFLSNFNFRSNFKLSPISFVQGRLFDAAGTVFERVQCTYDANFSDIDSFHFASVGRDVDFRANAVFDTLILGDRRYSSEYVFDAGTLIKITDSIAINTTGCNPALLETTISGSSASISMPVGTDLNTDFLNIQDITATGGGAFNAGGNSNDLGGNSGWNFSGPTYTLSLKVSDFCIDTSQVNILKGVPSGLPTNFWWKRLQWPNDTFNTLVDTIHVDKVSTFTFTSDYGGNCTITDTVNVIIAYPALGQAQTYYNLAEDSSWFNCSNWNLNLIPDSISDVSIAANERLYLDADTAYCKDFTNNGNMVMDGGVLMIYGHFDNQGTIECNGGEIHFMGTDSTVVKGNWLTFDTMVVNKYNGGSLHILVSEVIDKRLELISGIVHSSILAYPIIADNATSSEGSPFSFVDGPISKMGDDAFVFPTGDNGVWARCAMTAPGLTFNQVRAEYHSEPYTDTTNYNWPLNRVSKIEYWDIDRVVGTLSVRISLYFEDSSRSGIANTDTSALTVAHYNGSSWDDVSSVFDTLKNGKGYITSDWMTTFSPFTFGSKNQSNSLPVKWLDVSAKWNKDVADINWSTASEKDNQYFSIERSFNMKDFTEISQISSLARDGNSSRKLDYYHPDFTSFYHPSAQVFYRIKQVDFDGNFEYSEIVALQKSTSEDLIVQPNPSTGSFQIQLPQEGMILRLYDQFGREVHSVKAENQEHHLEVEHLRTGTYILEASQGAYKLRKRVLILD